MSKITLSSTVVYAKQLVLYVYSRDEREVHFRPPSNSERIVLQRRRIGCNELESLWIDWYALGNLMDLDRRNVIIKFRISYQSLVGSVVIGAELGRKDHGSIPRNCDREGAGTT
ncbi:hypothetical protein QL285_082838 [Trifolium repens]|nr:hypothetical protein QL285_082838 [Trifolium repens]